MRKWAFLLSANLFFAACHTRIHLKETEQDGIEKAMEQEFAMTKDPALGYIPTERLEKALAYVNSLSFLRGNNLSALSWQERGPNNIAGRTRALFVDARDLTGNTVFSASVSGGIWKATNFKTTPNWTPQAENMGSLAVCALAQDPSNPNTMYAGTGEGWFNVDAVRGNGIWKSTDGGTTWNKLPSTDSSVTTPGIGVANFDYIQDLAVTTQGTVFATSRPSRFCNRGGVMRSVDGGVTWTRVVGAFKPAPDPGPQTCDSAYNFYGADLEVGANGDIYATTGYQGSGANNSGRIFRSTAANNGAIGSWIDITPAGTWKRIEIACAPSAAGTIYALLQGSSNAIGAIKKSIDFGATWTAVPLPNWCNQGTASNDFTNSQAWYDLIVSVDPNNANTAIIGGIDLFKTTDGGATWTQITQWASGCTSLPQIHADQHNVVFFPGSSTDFIASNDGGVYYTNSGGSTWSSRNIGYNVTQLYSCDLHPTLTNYFLAGAQDNGTHKFTNPGINSTSRVSGGDGGLCHIDQTDGNIQLSAYVYNHYYYSRNGVTAPTFSQVSGGNDSGMFINPTDYDNAAHVLYTGDGDDQMGIVNGLSGTGTPSFGSFPITLGGRAISAVKVDPTVAGGGTVWVAGFKSGMVPNITKLNNVINLSPNVLLSVTLPSVNSAYVSSIDVDPGNANHLLVTLSNYGVVSVFESADGGNTWSNIEGNLPDVPVRWGMFVPANASVDGVTHGGILVGTEVGVWYTASTTGTPLWSVQNSGLPNVRVDMVKYRKSDLTVAVATHGRGLFTTTLTALSTAVPNVAITKDFIKYISATNNQLLVVKGSLINTRKINIRLFDSKGSLVYNQTKPYQNALINTSALSRGAYILHITGDHHEVFIKHFVK